VIRFVRDQMLPQVSKKLKQQSHLRTFFYGNFNADHDAWVTYPAQACYGTSYIGLRGRLGILAESYTYAPYKERVLKTREFVRACLEYAAANKAQVRQILAEADAQTIAAGRKLESDSTAKAGRKVAIRSQVASAPGTHRIAGFVEQKEAGKIIATSQPKDYQVKLFNRHRPTLKVKRQFAYVIPASMTRIIEALQRHGIEVEEFREDLELDLAAYRIASVRPAPLQFQGHRLMTAEVTTHKITRRIAAGTVLVRTGQKLGNLAVCLLEPQSDDGLVAWNFFDDCLNTGKEFPVTRLMKATPIISTPVRPLAEDRAMNKRLSFEAVYESKRPPNFSGSPVGGITWLEDGQHFLQNKEGKLRKVHAASGRSTVFLNTGAIARALGAIPTLCQKAGKELADRAAANLSKDRTATLFYYENDLYYARVDGTMAARLTSTPQPEELASFSPDGRFVAFVRGNDLYVVDVATRTERALTASGGERLLNGKADWVYFEEVFNRNHRAYWWSPDSQRLAFLETDNSSVKTFTLVNDLPSDQLVERTPYPRPGEPNPRVRLGTVTIAGGRPVFADLAGYDAEAHLITGVGWWLDSAAVYCYVQDRTQTWLDFCSISTEEGKCTRLFRDRTRAWVNAPAEPKFLGDGSFLITSERSGWQHLYHYTKEGRQKAAVTTGPWEVRRVLLVDESNSWIYFTGTKDSHIAVNLYRAHLDGTGLERLTKEPGDHRVQISPTGNAFIDTWSTRTMPAKVVLRKTDGSALRILDANPVYALEEYRLGQSKQFQIKMADGFLIEAAWVKPPDFEARKKYPVWFTTYAGPHAPTISDSWSGGPLWDQVLANAGIVVFHADPRPASGKGAQSAWTAYRQLGVQELKDIVEAIRWLKSHPWIDGSRIGMSGHSYGGFMTAYALTHSDVFAAGIAGAPPTDWRDYDTIYTERYMSTPQENPEGYDKSSVVKAAQHLHGRLLLVHGAIDDNVHPANTIKLVKSLQQSNKQFELMLYPGARHGIGGAQYQRLQYEFILRTIGSARLSCNQMLELKSQRVKELKS
jgi:dipeptidyl aminopeptidase/acylaminoacyl peptidase